MRDHIVQFGHPVLRKVGKDVPLDESLIPFMQQLLQGMAQANGIGLAAHQVGEARNIAVLIGGLNTTHLEIDGTLYKGDPLPIFLVNPQVISQSENIEMSEGCLSILNFFSHVDRPETIEIVTQWNPIQRKFKPTNIKCNGLTARAVQHELDHLNGILFTDYLDKFERARLVKKLKYPNEIPAV